MSNACEQCGTATDRCQRCAQSRCENHLAVSVVERRRPHAEGDVVLRVRYPDDVVFDFPVKADLTGDRRAKWIAGWSAGMNVCVGCRQAAAAEAVEGIKEERPEDETRTWRPDPPVDHHEALVKANREAHGPDQPARRRHAALIRRLQRPTARFAWLTVVLGGAAGAVLGRLTQASADWVEAVDDAFAGGGEPLLLAQAYRDRAALVLGALAGALIALLVVTLSARRARRDRQRRLTALDREASAIGCGRHGCELCSVPRPAVELRVPYPVGRGHALAVLAAAALAAGLTGLLVVALPAKAVTDFSRDGIPAAIRADCSPRKPQAGDYELVCAGPSLRRRDLSRVVYRHYADPGGVDLSRAFARSKDFRACGKPRKLPGHRGRIVYCNPPGTRQGSIWTTGDDVIGSALGTGARKFARLQL